MAVYEEPGRGRKQCKNCKKYVGVRSTICEVCSTPFDSAKVPEEKVVKVEKAKTVVENVPTVAEESAPTITQTLHGKILTPAGKCPVNLNSTEAVDIFDWKRRLAESNPGLTDQAVAYYVRQFYRYGSSEHTKVLGVLGGSHVVA